MKEAIKTLAVHNKPLAKCLAIEKYIKYIKRGNGYQEVYQVLETFVKTEKKTDHCYIRRFTKVSGQEDKAAFEQFLSKRKEFVVKPMQAASGSFF